MRKNLIDQDFFLRDPRDVAIDLLGKFVCNRAGEKYQIIATEAYYHDEKDKNNKNICYGADKTKEKAKHSNLVVAALFDRPGTWCIYCGQLLLSVTNDQFSDNVLVKAVKNEAYECLRPNKMAHALCLYKSKPEYCKCHGQYSLDTNSNLYLIDGKEPSKISTFPRININSKKELCFVIDSK